MTKNTTVKNTLPGLTGNQIKYMAAAMMLLDHIYQMFGVHGAPVWLTWIGRLVAPIFLFMSAEGFHHTHSRRQYMLLLLSGFEFMGLANTFLSRIMPNENAVLINNIFGTLFLATLYMLAVDMLRAGAAEKKAGKILLSVLLMLLPFAASLPPLLIMSSPELASVTPHWVFVILANLIPGALLVEGGPSLILMGLLFYIFRNKRALQAAALTAMSVLALLTIDGPQWFMVFAMIPLLLYNGKRGGGGKANKYFFYIFYPAHIYLLYTAEWFFQSRF
jgi:hypothetical protein